MAQASSFKPSIHYQVCNSKVDNDIPRLSSIKSSQQAFSSIVDDDLCEITILPSRNKKSSLPLSSPNHHTSLLKNRIPISSAGGHVSTSVESTTRFKSIKYSSSSSFSPLTKNPRGSSASIHSLSKRTSTQQCSSANSSNPPHNRQSSSRQSIFDTLATTLTAVRKSSTTALALAQQRLSTDNGNIFAAYQGKISKR
ncbi:unnamed protein product [Rotaria sp. Silwood2]|nr:unnamed protein product [Rotaria sp. Silwood2]